MSADYTPFEQRESLTTRLRNVLREYTMGPSVLQEFLQNADDARAKHFALVLDLEGTATAEVALSNGEMTGLVEATRPPSLFVYNDASFR